MLTTVVSRSSEQNNVVWLTKLNYSFNYLYFKSLICVPRCYLLLKIMNVNWRTKIYGKIENILPNVFLCFSMYFNSVLANLSKLVSRKVSLKILYQILSTYSLTETFLFSPLLKNQGKISKKYQFKGMILSRVPLCVYLILMRTET